MANHLFARCISVAAVVRRAWFGLVDDLLTEVACGSRCLLDRLSFLTKWMRGWCLSSFEEIDPGGRFRCWMSMQRERDQGFGSDLI